ncbi:thioredoxin domain-containing protein [Microbulbifer guangxiensis]|uniref:thioredoxin domain-containing protein n=1 Tax=Microbulbifer guangxiensis TaxID=2904249 RepID=UPI001F1F4CC6|nr:thioredoxin domain-containing protein [Microbulbifer guangxiensis]
MDERNNPLCRYMPLLLLIFSVLLGACTADRQEISANQSQVVARIGEQAITLAEVDQKIQLQRHDLALTEYQLRFNTLKSMVDAVTPPAASGAAAPTVTWLLPHPRPPRLEIDTRQRAMRGNPEAPVTLAVFCSYQSVHCAATNLVVRQLLDRYAGWISVAPFDFPMHFHRQGVQAANAVHCASQQGTPWAYADGLYSHAKALDKDVYGQLASQLGFTQDAFDRCQLEADHNEQIAEDTAFARQLGLQSVPVVFINGLYTRGPKTAAHYGMWIDEELERLGHNPSTPHPEAARWRLSTDRVPETDLPLQLTGTSVSSRAQQSSALIRIREASANRFSPGDTLMRDVTLKAIHERHVILTVNGRLERLSLRGEDDDFVRVPKTGSTQRDEETLRRIEQPEGETRKLLAPSGVLPLGQEWLQKQLQDREALEKKFVEAEHVVDGYNLLRLEGIENNEFFTALGFEEGDVVVRVNDTWVHSGQNQLWDALTSGEMVDVTFMRNGLPQRVQYVVEDRGYFEDQGDQQNSGDGDSPE